LREEGANELPSSKKRNSLHILLDVVRAPMFLLLLACGLVYLALGDHEEAYMLLGSIFFIIGITFYQERKAERALEALKELASPRALVIRHGQRLRIPGREVVRGDLLILSEGDRVPADAALLENNNLSADESLLTGESVPVTKKVWDGRSGIGRPGGDGLPYVFSGTLIVKGRGLAQVMATGGRTEIGKIGISLEWIEEEETSLQRQTKSIVRWFALGGLVLCALVVAILGRQTGDWLQGLLAGLTLAMAILPEEFLVVLTIFLAIGAWRISRRNVLTRRAPTIEMLGATTVLCVDKTGTITMNQMSVAWILAREDLKNDTVAHALRASPKDPFDPLENAIKNLANELGIDSWADAGQIIKEYPLTGKLMAMTQAWRTERGGF